MIDASLLAKGQTLATVDDVTYQAVRLVFACTEDDAPSLYCSLDDWPASHAARLDEKNREIAELESILSRQAAESLKQAQRAIAAEARIKELEAQLAETPAQNQAAQFAAQAAYIKDTPPDPPADPIVCPDCGKTGWKNAHALDVHRGRTHQAMVAAKATPAQFVEELGWRCAAKGCSGAFARDLHDVDFCTQHAAPRANGHEIAA
jgi:hypothetical protein